MTKYKEYVKKMLDNNKSLFNSFKKVHDEYSLNPEKFQDPFNKEGIKILEIIRDYENKLCMQSEKGGYGVYTTKLAEKFQEEIKKHFPKIDHIGLKIEKFSIKKINLH